MTCCDWFDISQDSASLPGPPPALSRSLSGRSSTLSELSSERSSSPSKYFGNTRRRLLPSTHGSFNRRDVVKHRDRSSVTSSPKSGYDGVRTQSGPQSAPSSYLLQLSSPHGNSNARDPANYRSSVTRIPISGYEYGVRTNSGPQSALSSYLLKQGTNSPSRLLIFERSPTFTRPLLVQQTDDEKHDPNKDKFRSI